MVVLGSVANAALAKLELRKDGASTRDSSRVSSERRAHGAWAMMIKDANDDDIDDDDEEDARC